MLLHHLIACVSSLYGYISDRLSCQQYFEVLEGEVEIKDRTAKKSIVYMKEQGVLRQDAQGNYQETKSRPIL